MEQAAISATDSQISSSGVFLLKPLDAVLDTMRIGEIELITTRTVNRSRRRVHLLHRQSSS